MKQNRLYYHGILFESMRDYHNWLLDRVTKFEKAAPNSTITAKYYDELEECIEEMMDKK
jgi:hypothetical protein